MKRRSFFSVISGAVCGLLGLVGCQQGAMANEGPQETEWKCVGIGRTPWVAPYSLMQNSKGETRPCID